MGEQCSFTEQKDTTRKTLSTLLDFTDVAPFFQFYCYLRSYIWAFPGKTMFEKINGEIRLSFGNTDYSFCLKNEADQKSSPSHLEFSNKYHNKNPKPDKARDFRHYPTEWTGDCLNITEQRCRNCRKRTSDIHISVGWNPHCFGLFTTNAKHKWNQLHATPLSHHRTFTYPWFYLSSICNVNMDNLNTLPCVWI